MTAEPSGSGPEANVAAAAGDPAAFREIVLRYDAGLRSLAYRMLRDRDLMDDVLQEAYLKAYRALGRFDRRSDVGTWLYRITYNTCIDQLRRSGNREWVEYDDRRHDGVASDPTEAITDRIVVEEALARLSPGYRAVLLLVDGQGFDYREAGEVLGLSEGSVASRLHRARQAMHRALSAERSQL
ncbi:MAG TPA: RNA polymerase sigma factor [Acidimicrobiia bacterium]|jgi:RNA polymerase sigma-70 factor (ECF subfamily)